MTQATTIGKFAAEKLEINQFVAVESTAATLPDRHYSVSVSA